MKLIKSNKLNWFCRLQGNWFRRETGLAGKPVWQGNRFGRETGLAEKPVWQGNCFLVTLAKIFIIILVVKQNTYNAKVSDITIL